MGSTPQSVSTLMTHAEAQCDCGCYTQPQSHCGYGFPISDPQALVPLELSGAAGWLSPYPQAASIQHLGPMTDKAVTSCLFN